MDTDPRIVSPWGVKAGGWVSDVGSAFVDGSRPYIGMILAVVATVWAWTVPSFKVWRTFDGANHMFRTHFLLQMASQGEWFPRWFPQQYGGYGYPTLTFYAPLTYFLMAGLEAVLPGGSSIQDAYEAVLVLSAFVVVTGTYSLGWSLWRHAPAAILMAVSVAYGPYVLQTNLLLAGAAPHVLGLGLMPWMLVCMHEGWRQVPGCAWWRRGWWWGTVACVSLLLLTHGISALLGAGLASAWFVTLFVCRPEWTAAVRTAGAAVLGALTTTFSWYPTLANSSLVQTERMQLNIQNFRNWFIHWPGYHPPLWGLQERSPYTIGFPVDLHLVYSNVLTGPMRLSLWQAVILLTGIAYLGWRLWRRPSGEGLPTAVTFPVAFGVIVALVLYANQFDWAVAVWEAYPALQKIQMPTRLLGPIAFAVALVLGGTVTVLPRTGWATFFATASIAAVLVASGVANRGADGGGLPYLVADDGGIRLDDSVIDEVEVREPGYTASTNEFLPRTANYETWHEGEARGFWLYDRLFPDAGWVAGQVMPWAGLVAVHGVARVGLSWVVDVTVTPGDEEADGGVLAFHQLAFPGWRAWVDGRPVAISAAPVIVSQSISPGFILVPVPTGAHRVSIRFGADGPRIAGAVVSAGAVLLSSVGIVLGVGRARSLASVLGVALIVLVLAGCTGALGLVWMGTRPPDSRLGDYGYPLEAMIVTSVIDRVLDGSAEVRSPTGAERGETRYVDVRSLTVLAQDRPLRDSGPRSRRWLYTHPPAVIAMSVDIPVSREGRRPFLQAGIVMDPRMWNAALGDGVRHTVVVNSPGTSGSVEAVTIFDEVVNPRAYGDQRRWVDVVVPLERWEGERIRLEFRTDARDEPSNDWAGWGEPVVVQLDALAAGRMVRSAGWEAKVALGRR